MNKMDLALDIVALEMFENTEKEVFKIENELWKMDKDVYANERGFKNEQL